MKRIFRRSKSQTSLKVNKPLPDIIPSPTSNIPPVPLIPEKHRQASLPLLQHDFMEDPSITIRQRTRSTGTQPVLILQDFTHQDRDIETEKVQEVYDFVSKPAETAKKEIKVDKISKYLLAE